MFGDMDITPKQYYKNCSSTEERIKAIKTIIDNILLAMTEGGDNMGKNSYSFDDGQMKVTINYKSLDELTTAFIKWSNILNLLERSCGKIPSTFTGRQFPAIR